MEIKENHEGFGVRPKKKFMKHYTIIFLVIIISTAPPIKTQEQDQKLDYFIGEWKSVSIDQTTGEEITGHSVINRVIGKKWIEWSFRMPLASGELEVITLINYDEEKKQYAFYSFNPMDEEPIPHFGNWIDEKNLQIKTDFGGEVVRVDFILKDESNFEQIHSHLTSDGEKEVTSITIYSKIK